MRNLLGRLHARRLPELLRIADAWGVPLHVESKGEVVGALYRAMTDPRAIRDLWARLSERERAVAVALANSPDGRGAPTVSELAVHLGIPEQEARETAIGLYRAGVLAREGDDEPLPVGVSPRLILPREIALSIRRVQDEMAAGNLAQSPLRVLIELLDDAELEAAARIWGLRTLPGAARRSDLASRLLRLTNDGARVERVVRGRGRDAVAIWEAARSAPEPLPLADVAAAAGLGGGDSVTAARLRAALAELEAALLVWHAYRPDGSRWVFVPAEIRSPGKTQPSVLPPLEQVPRDVAHRPPWRHPDSIAWDLLTLLRTITGPRAPAWEVGETPRWLARAVGPRFWYGARDGLPTGYLELLQHLGLAEGVLAIDEEQRPPRIVAGPHARAWRSLAFSAQTARLRDRWLRLPRWIEGESAGIVDVWGADWRGMRPRLLAALADGDIGLDPDEPVSLESLSSRIAARFPALLGPSFMAATARMGGEIGAGADEAEARQIALGEVIAFELAGPFSWFGLTSLLDQPGKPRAVSVTAAGRALATRQPLAAADDGDAGRPPLVIDESGEITLRSPSPDRVWALSAFTEPVDLGQLSHYRLTEGSIANALAIGVEIDQITGFLERGSREPLPAELAARLAAWARGHRRLALRRAVVLQINDAAERPALLDALREAAWPCDPLGDDMVVVPIAASVEAERGEEALLDVLRAAGHTPRWVTP